MADVGVVPGSGAGDKGVPVQGSDDILLLRHFLFFGSNPNDFGNGVSSIKLVDEYLVAERKKKKAKESQKPPGTFDKKHAELRQRFECTMSVAHSLMLAQRHQELLECLTVAMEKRAVCWQAVVSCLVMGISGAGSTSETVKASYAAMPSVIKNSTMLFFFLQLLKVAAPNQKKIGWGMGLKKCVCKWYRNLTPSLLLLELWHRPRRHGWTHKDIIRLVHLDVNSLPLGSQVILTYFFSDLMKTKVAYCANKQAAKYIGWLDGLYNRAHENKLAEMQLQVLLNLEEDNHYNLIREQDPLLKSVEVFSMMCPLLRATAATTVSQDSLFLRVVVPRGTAAQAGAAVQVPNLDDAADALQSLTLAEGAAAAATVPSVAALEHVELLQLRLSRPDVAGTVPPSDALIALNNFNRRVKSNIQNLQGRNTWYGAAIAPPRGVGPPPAAAPPRATAVPRADKPRVDIPDHVRPIQIALDAVLVASIKTNGIAPCHPRLLAVFEPCGSCKNYINTELGFNIHKQMRASQAVAISLFRLCYVPGGDDGGFGDRVMIYSKQAFEPYTVVLCNFKIMSSALEDLCVSPTLLPDISDSSVVSTAFTTTSTVVPANFNTCADFEQLKEACLSLNKTELVYFCYNLSKMQLEAAYEYLRRRSAAAEAGEQEAGLTKIVLVGLEFTDFQTLPFDPRILIVNGFNRRSLDVICAFLQGDF